MINLIIKYTEKEFKLYPGEINLKTRKREISEARQVAMYFAVEILGFNGDRLMTLKQIGQSIGNKDHSTVLHAHKTIINLIKTDKRIRASVDNIRKDINLFTGMIKNIDTIQVTEEDKLTAMVTGLSKALKKSNHWNQIYKSMLCCD